MLPRQLSRTANIAARLPRSGCPPSGAHQTTVAVLRAATSAAKGPGVGHEHTARRPRRRRTNSRAAPTCVHSATALHLAPVGVRTEDPVDAHAVRRVPTEWPPDNCATPASLQFAQRCACAPRPRPPAARPRSQLGARSPHRGGVARTKFHRHQTGSVTAQLLGDLERSDGPARYPRDRTMRAGDRAFVTLGYGISEPVRSTRATPRFPARR